MTQTQITLTVETVLDCFLGVRPYRFINESDELYQKLFAIPKDDRNLFVIENDEWTIGYDNGYMPRCHTGIWRLWYKKDWTICDNRRQEVVNSIEAKQAAYKAKRDNLLAVVKADFLAKGIQEVAWNFISGSFTMDQLETMATAIKPTTPTV